MTTLLKNGALYQCIPNFSEGRRPETVAPLVTAADAFTDVRVVNWTMDADHNRSVITLLGEAPPIHDAVLAMASIAVARIDLRNHNGVHPRTGAVDVVPVVPIRNALRMDANLLAQSIGSSLAQQLNLPVYFYEWSANPGRSLTLPEIRRKLKSAHDNAAVHLIGDLAPDVGPTYLHPTAGITVVGARGPLAAYNIDLQSDDVRLAKAIAHVIRSSRNTVPYLTGVQALGLYLPTRNRAQVSMNLTKPDCTPLPAVWNFVQLQARMLGTDVVQSEIIGLVSASWLAGASPADINWTDFTPSALMDIWLEHWPA